jgi:hypothetical protein
MLVQKRWILRLSGSSARVLGNLSLRKHSTERPIVGVLSLRKHSTERPMVGVLSLRKHSTERPIVGVLSLRKLSTERPMVGVLSLRKHSTERPSETEVCGGRGRPLEICGETRRDAARTRGTKHLRNPAYWSPKRVNFGPLPPF